MKTTKGFHDISDSIAAITETFGPESATGKAMRDGLGHLIDAIGRKVKEINWNHVADSITRIVDKTTQWVDPVIKIAEYLAKIVDYGVKLGGIMLDAKTALTNPGSFIADKIFGSAEDEAEAQAKAKRLEADNLAGWEEVAKESGTKVGEAGAEGYRDATETHSPSRVWMRLGQDTIEGLAMGMEYAAPRAQAAAAAAIAPPVADVASGGSSSSFSAGGITVNVQVNVGASSGAPQEIGREAADQTVAALLPALEQFAIQAGLA